ncbi:C47 family peptidase [Candidatus Enterococcus ikei]|uniref:Peptidase C39-like domain-containing protein n=1 Tax=Candidatus Enterococcus ikei TaxID=2815326 RepID=A0ABS3H0D9_9ENTE|nr:C47 family peptidase [Enterococcus sp. DIV0869a]MBO0440971.1 hypothetical protein [Enterococcus sp. DIV0869a]
MLRKKWLVIVICILGLFSSKEIAFATENKLSVSTPPISEEIKVYAKENVSFYLAGFLSLENKTINTKDYDLLEPFQMVSENNEQKTNIFPITEDGVVTYVLYLNESVEGSYDIKISKFLAEKLESLRAEKRNEDSVSFIEKNGDIYIKHGSQIEKIYVSPLRPETEDQVTSDSLNTEFETADTETLPLETLSDVKPTPNIGQRSITSDRYGTKINWLVHETQGQNSWCSAYAAAMILNNKNDARPTKVSDMVKWGKKGKNDAFSYTDVIKYANTRGVYPYYVGRPMNWNEVETQIKKSNAIWGAWEGISGKDYKGLWHAIDIVGTYQTPIWGLVGVTQVAYVVWNPWYGGLELCNADNNTYSVIGGTFAWRYSVTNW